MNTENSTSQIPQRNEPVHPSIANNRVVLYRRFVALVIDLILCLFILFIINQTFGVKHITGGNLPPLEGGGGGWYSYATDISVGWGGFWNIVIPLLYFTFFEALIGTTPGKRMLQLHIVDEFGQRPSLNSIVTRNILRVLDMQPFWFSLLFAPFPGTYLTGALLVWFTSNHQRLGDIVARTYVVDALLSPRSAKLRFQVVRAGIIFVCFSALLIYCAYFSYYGRPPLVIEGEKNLRQGMLAGAITYTLGDPKWGDGTVSYPVTFTRKTDGRLNNCEGTVVLKWYGFASGWQISGGDSGCSPDDK